MAKSTPAFQFYPDDFLGGTAHFTASEVGGYIRLLCHQWKHGAVPADNTDRIATIMGMSRASAKSAWQVLSEKFIKGDDGQWRNPKMEKVRAGKMRFIQAQTENGVKGAAARWGFDGQAHAQNDGQSHGGNDGSPNLSISQSNESKNDSLPPPRDLLAVHHTLFVAKYGTKPSYDGAKDAAIAKRLIERHGFDGASELLKTYFESGDSWLSKSGHGMGPLGSATTINKLIAESSARNRLKLRAVPTSQHVPCAACGDSGWVQAVGDAVPKRCGCKQVKSA
jgi:uncharacterized protein YdaU (DUF1376 family)